MKDFKHIEWKDDTLYVLNQIKLPAVTEYNPKRTVEEVFHAIRDMELRGAPLIGIAAGYGMYLGMKDLGEVSHEEFMAVMRKNGEYLAQSRPILPFHFKEFLGGRNRSGLLDNLAQVAQEA